MGAAAAPQCTRPLPRPSRIRPGSSEPLNTFHAHWRDRTTPQNVEIVPVEKRTDQENYTPTAVKWSAFCPPIALSRLRLQQRAAIQPPSYVATIGRFAATFRGRTNL